MGVEMFKDESEVKAFYRDKYKQFGDTAQGMAWANQESHYKRVQAAHDLVGIVNGLHWIRPREEVEHGKGKQDIANTRILDVGCGIGMLPLIWDLQFNSFAEYVGVDLVPEYVEVAKSRRFNTRFMFRVEDFLAGDYDPFHVSVALGTLAWQPQLTATRILMKMWDLTEEAMVFTYMPDQPIPTAAVRLLERQLGVKQRIEYKGYADTVDTMVVWSKV